MSLITEQEPQDAAPQKDDTALRDLRDEVRAQGKSIRLTQQAFMMVAIGALILGMVNLIVVAAKLQKKTPARQAVAAAAPATKAAAAAPPSRVTVGLREFTVNPSSSTAKAGKVTFAVSNAGRVTHEFVVLRTNKPAANLMKGSRADETGNVGETGDLAPGASKTIAITLKPGHYALICNLPGHYAAGQHTDFTVR